VIFSERIRMSQDDGEHPGPQPGAWVPPPQHFAPPHRHPTGTPPPVVAAPHQHRTSTPGNRRTVLIGAVIVVLAVAAVALTSGEPDRPQPRFVGLPPAPAGPTVPSATAPPTTPSRSAPLATSRVRDVEPGTGTTAVTSRVPSASAAPPVALPRAGQALGLAPVGEPGRRIRHRNFVARIDPVGPASPDLDRADSRFTARAGRANAGCVSFESFNYPGYFLRSRDAALRLERADGSRGYDTDATFCPIPTTGGGFALRSHDDPNRYVTERDDVLSLTRVPLAEAKTFVTRPPLA
jgi:hypothetical protein